MTKGFAMVAWPAEYGNSGLMTFIVDEQGIVFQKDPGDDTSAAAAAITSFDPDDSWVPRRLTSRERGEVQFPSVRTAPRQPGVGGLHVNTKYECPLLSVADHLGLEVVTAEDGAGWLAFVRGLVARGTHRRAARDLRCASGAARGPRRDAARRGLVTVPHALHAQPADAG